MLGQPGRKDVFWIVRVSKTSFMLRRCLMYIHPQHEKPILPQAEAKRPSLQSLDVSGTGLGAVVCHILLDAYHDVQWHRIQKKTTFHDVRTDVRSRDKANGFLQHP